MNKEYWEDEFESVYNEEFSLLSPHERIKDFISELLIKDRYKINMRVEEQLKQELITKIEKLKEQTRLDTGAYKFDFAYDEVIELLKP